MTGDARDAVEAVRATKVPVRWDSNYDQECIVAFTRDREPSFVQAFDRFMHFVE